MLQGSAKQENTVNYSICCPRISVSGMYILKCIFKYVVNTHIHVYIIRCADVNAEYSRSFRGHSPAHKTSKKKQRTHHSQWVPNPTLSSKADATLESEKQGQQNNGAFHGRNQKLENLTFPLSALSVTFLHLFSGLS